MSRKVSYLLLGIFATIKLIDYLTTNESEDFFGFEVGIWFHRIFWLVMLVAFWVEFYRNVKAAKKENEELQKKDP